MTTTAWPVTAAADRDGKFQVQRKPRSGADFWVKAPVDDAGRPECPDLHLSVARAEELGYALLQAVEDLVQADLDLEGGLPLLGDVRRSCQVPGLQAADPARHGDVGEIQGRVLLR